MKFVFELRTLAFIESTLLFADAKHEVQGTKNEMEY